MQCTNTGGRDQDYFSLHLLNNYFFFLQLDIVGQKCLDKRKKLERAITSQQQPFFKH